ncbi:LOW QUALITY PROTEIN: hypothetical protein Cgig2_022980 [Carnegiea gigantea]|uniref:Uncharacterized protein n=1 Tax=Carnegiea gigantea TaxID=171969 RepID=A0A9Q1Q6S4_9CARY|nr:LOW QUALITY PROTEIN: hypothetical protein Cgig2_022980 [Carnegiea gigantea]
MIDAIMQQISEQVKKAVEAISSVRPLSHFEYVPTGACEPSHRHGPATSSRCSGRVQKAPHGGGDRRSRKDNHGRSIGANACPNHRSSHGRLMRSTTASTPYVLPAEQGSHVTVPTMVFGGEQGPRFTSLHNDPLVVGMKCDCVKNPHRHRKLRGHHHMVMPKEADISGKGHHPIGPPNPGFWGQEVNPTRVIRLPLRFGDKGKAKNVEVDFLVIDVPTAYNIILGRPTLHKVKAVITPYLLQLQFEADDGNVGTILLWNRRMREGQAVTGKRPQTEPPLVPPPAAEALVIHTLASVEHDRPRPKAAESVKQVQEERRVHSTCLSNNHLLLSDLKGFEVPEAAKSHVLARSRTSSNLAAESAAKKFVERARVPMGVSPTDGRQLRPRLRCTKLKRVRSELNEKADQGRDVEEPIPRLSVTGFALPILRPLYRSYHLDHKLRNRPRAVVLLYIINKVASRPLLFIRRLPKGIPDWLLFDKGRPIDRDTFQGRLINGCIRLGENETISRRQEILLLEASKQPSDLESVCPAHLGGPSEREPRGIPTLWPRLRGPALKDTGGGRILVIRTRGSAGLKNRHCGNVSHHPAINKGREAMKRRVPAHLTDILQFMSIQHESPNSVDHNIEDRLHHLQNVGVVGVLCSHAEVKARVEAAIVLREWVRTASGRLSQMPARSVPNVFGRLLGAGEVWEKDHFPSLILYLSLTKVNEIYRMSPIEGASPLPFMVRGK